jgi:hypothetical protein
MPDQVQNTAARMLAVKGAALLRQHAEPHGAKGIAEGCVVDLGMGECTKELEATLFEADGISDYCLTVEEKANGARRPECAIPRM